MIKKFSIAFLLFCCGILYSQKNYYFSSSAGSNSNVGSETSPFQTISKLNSLVLVPGDKILFKRGDAFIGQILVSYSGTLGKPIVYDSYGTGDLPVLTASNGSNGIADPLSTIKIEGKQYLEFRNLTIENERFDTASGSPDSQAYGIYFRSWKTLPTSKNFEDTTLFKYFRFSNLRFQNIYSVNSVGTAFDDINTSGIQFFNAFANDVIIEDCSFTDIERVGIWLRQYVSDAIVRNNKFIDLGGSGTIISSSKRVLYEKNLMRFTGSDSDSRMTKRGSGMWVFGSDDVVAQYNTSQHARGNGDSSGMHVDYGNSNILFQYNYLEDSAGGFCETLGDNVNIIWRYNISVNEGGKERSGKNILLWVSDYAYVNKKSEKVFIYNNTIYQGLKYQNVMADSKISLEASSLNFINNIIYLEPTAKLGVLAYLFDVNVPSFSNNILFGGTIKSTFKNLDATRKEVDPKFLDSGRRHFSGYKLLSTSPALGSALPFLEPVFPLAGVGIFADITSNASKDIFGNPVNLATATNIGAYNGSGESKLPIVNSYEAESGIIVGGIEINCVNASGGKAVNVLDAGKSLTFNAIDAVTSDLYFIKIFYANGIKSNLKLTINGADTETIILPNTDAYCSSSGNPTNFPVLKNLIAGNNSIKLENGTIDKIEVVSVTDAILSTENFGFLSKTEAYLEKTMLSSNETLRVIIDKKIEYQNAEVSIYDISGALLSKKNFTSGDINLETSSLGKGVKIVTARIGSYLFVDKILVH
ncbi:right-handed parallel beta-helix repeat-containing protein [Flavobacterium sp.]|uniref:right-handed parallel beta-helix repeat-containing protein n=1 Tax=Flavobacterium sp. TaxID=239 RepID=UPI00286DC1D5|nr:right-handed parallel beta-helix repeat-containing protein [Flavobacterium sp.]